MTTEDLKPKRRPVLSTAEREAKRQEMDRKVKELGERIDAAVLNKLTPQQAAEVLLARQTATDPDEALERAVRDLMEAAGRSGARPNPRYVLNVLVEDYGARKVCLWARELDPAFDSYAED